jgi:hypothetical protein
MYAVEFEADVTSPFIQLHNYEQFMNQHVKVIVLAQGKRSQLKVRPTTDYIQTLRQRRFNVASDVNVDALMSEMNHGLS